MFPRECEWVSVSVSASVVIVGFFCESLCKRVQECVDEIIESHSRE